MIDKPFIERLMDLITVEANNGDYYVDGYVDASKLDELINEFYPEYEFTSAYTYSQWRPRDPRSSETLLKVMNFYNGEIVRQLSDNSTIFHKMSGIPVDKADVERVTFKIQGSKTGRYPKNEPFKKDG